MMKHFCDLCDMELPPGNHSAFQSHVGAIRVVSTAYQGFSDVPAELCADCLWGILSGSRGLPADEAAKLRSKLAVSEANCKKLIEDLRRSEKLIAEHAALNQKLCESDPVDELEGLRLANKALSRERDALVTRVTQLESEVAGQCERRSDVEQRLAFDDRGA